MTAKEMRDQGGTLPSFPPTCQLKLHNPGFTGVCQSVSYQGPTWLSPKTPGDLQICCVLVRGGETLDSDGTTRPAAALIVLQGQMATLNTRDTKRLEDRSCRLSYNSFPFIHKSQGASQAEGLCGLQNGPNHLVWKHINNLMLLG